MANLLIGALEARPLVDFVEGEETRLLAIFQIDFGAVVNFGAHQAIAPPCRIAILGHHVAIVRTTEIEVFEGELLLCHGRSSVQWIEQCTTCHGCTEHISKGFSLHYH